MKKILILIPLTFFQLLMLASSFPLVPCAFNRYEEISTLCTTSRYVSLLVSIIAILLTIPLIYYVRRPTQTPYRFFRLLYIIIILVEIAILVRIFY